MRSSVTARAASVAKYIACHHCKEFVLAAKEDAGLMLMESMGTNECEAMIQDANLTTQFSAVHKHVTVEACDSFKMMYPPSELEQLEGATSGPEPMFGVYKSENDNGDIEHCQHWSTLVSEELSFAIRNDILNSDQQSEA